MFSHAVPGGRDKLNSSAMGERRSARLRCAGAKILGVYTGHSRFTDIESGLVLQMDESAGDAWQALKHGSLCPMSAVLVAAFNDHATADAVRTRLVKDGFPTDRVELTSCQELGQVKLVPRASVGEKLTEYFAKLFQSGGNGERSARLFQRAVLDGKATIAVQPRGDIETQRALELLNDAGPVELRGADLDNQTLEHAATETETPVITWMGKVLAAPGAPDTTGLPKLP